MQTSTAAMPTENRTDSPQQAALRALSAPVLANAGIRYQSRGRVVVIGQYDVCLPLVQRLQAMPDVILLTDSRPEDAPKGVHLFVAAAQAIEGHLGQFDVYVAANEASRAKLADAIGGGFIDIIVDLQDKPLLAMEALPPGYFRPGLNDLDYESLAEEVQGLVGEFEKPKYVNYDANACMHAVGSREGCDRCLQVCSAWAIRPEGDGVAIDFNRCHGIGSCATACPTGAISYQFPDGKQQLKTFRDAINAYQNAGGSGLVLLIHAREDTGFHHSLPEHVVPIHVEEIGSVGMEVWLSALAWGAETIYLLTGSDTYEPVKQLLDDELHVARHLLDGLRLDPDRLRRLESDTDAGLFDELATIPSYQPRTLARFAAVSGKRAQLWLAIDALQDQGQPVGEVIPLPDGAPFGTVNLDQSRCTLCMSCVAACKPAALHDGGDQPRLDFVEQNCVQCGLCSAVCPEQAISLTPRLNTDADARIKRTTLQQEEPFACVRCGKPFATHGVIERMVEQLANHSMFQGGAIERLKMCEECRVVAFFDDEQRVQGG